MIARFGDPKVAAPLYARVDRVLRTGDALPEIALVKRSSLDRIFLIGLAAGLAIATAMTPAVARAQSAKEIAAAKQAFKEGEAAEAKGELTTALARFQSALAVKETAQLHLRVGTVQEKLGKLVDALASYKRGLDKAAALPAVAKIAKEQIAAIEPKIPSVTVTLASPAGSPPGLAITLDDAPYDASSLGTSKPLDPGQHRVRAEAPGRVPFERAFMADRGITRIEIALAPIATTQVEEARSKVPGALVTAGGAAALLAGAVLIGLSVSKDSSIDALCGGSDRLACPESRRAEIESDVRGVNATRFAGIGVGVVGAVGVAVGSVLLVKAAKPKEVSSGVVDVRPLVGLGVVGVMGRF